MSRIPSRRTRRGFTLFEVLMVLVILVILGSLAVTAFSGTRDKARIDAAQAQIDLFGTQIELFNIHVERFPGNLDELIGAPSEAREARKWGGPYINKKVLPVDPWESEYQYARPGQHNPDGFDVWSAGPDRQEGTEDDIGNWEAS